MDSRPRLFVRLASLVWAAGCSTPRIHPNPPDAASPSDSAEPAPVTDGPTNDPDGSPDEGWPLADAAAPSTDLSGPPADLAPPAVVLPARICGELGPDVISVAFSPDGTRLAAIGRTSVQVVTSPGAASLLSEPADGIMADTTSEVAFSPDGTRVAAGGRHARVWRISDGALLADLAPPGLEYYAGVAFSPDGRLLALSLHTAGVQIYTWPALEKQHQWRPADAAAFGALAFSADGLLLTLRTFHDVRRVRADTGETLWRQAAAPSHPDMALSRDGQLLATSGLSGPVRVQRTEDGALVRQFERKDGRVSFSADGELLLAGDRRAPAVVWRVRDGSVAVTFPARGPRALALSPDGAVLVSVAEDGTTALWCR